jgi:O-antigen/teichoic acid export membrane protein
LGQVLVLATTPLISRLYTQSEVGEFGLFLSFLSVGVVASTARYELAIPSAETDQDALAILLLTLSLSVPVAFLGGICLWLLIKSNILAFGALPSWTAIVIVPALVLLGAFTALRYWFVRERRFGELGRVIALQGAARAFVPVVLGFAHIGSVGLMSGEIAGRGVGVGRMLRTAYAGLRDARLKSWPVVREVAARHWKYPGVLLPSGLLDVCGLALPVPLISQEYGVAAAGSFLLVQRLTAVPASLVGASVGDIFHSRMAEAMAANPVLAKGILDRAALRLLKFGAVVFLPAAFIAPFVLPPLLGPQWKDSGVLLTAVIPWSLASLIVTPLSRVLAISDKKELKLIYDCSALILLIGAILIGSRLRLGLVATIFLTSAGQVIAYVLYFLLIRRACQSSAFAPRIGWTGNIDLANDSMTEDSLGASER